MQENGNADKQGNKNGYSSEKYKGWGKNSKNITYKTSQYIWVYVGVNIVCFKDKMLFCTCI